MAIPYLDHELLKEEQYKPDLELLDRFTGFSSELVRLASLGLGGLALFLQSSLLEQKKQEAELQVQIADLQKQAAELQTQVTNLEQQTAGLQNLGADLQRHVTGLQGLVASLQQKPTGLEDKLEQGWFNLLLGGSALLFGVAIACGLLHRFYATDGLAYHIHAHRLAQSKDDRFEAEVAARGYKYKFATSWLISSECAVAAGALVAGMAFAIRFSVIDTKWITALVLAVVAVLVAGGIAGYRWWRWRRNRNELKKKGDAAQPEASTGQHRKSRGAAG